MKYYFCIDLPFENTIVTEYTTLQELYEDEKDYIKNNNNWFIIKGDEIDL